MAISAKKARAPRKTNSGVTAPVETNDFITIGAPIVTPELTPKARKITALAVTTPVIEGVLFEGEIPDNEPLNDQPEFDFNAYRNGYAKTTRVFPPNVAPKVGSQTHHLFVECALMAQAGLFCGNKTVDKKVFMACTQLPYSATSLSAGFYQWVRSLRPMLIDAE